MEKTILPGRLRKFEIPGRVTFANVWLLAFIGENRPCGLPHQPRGEPTAKLGIPDFLFAGQPTHRHIRAP